MTCIRSVSEILLRSQHVSEEDERKFIAIIHDATERLTRLLDEILDLGRLESGTSELVLGPVEIEHGGWCVKEEQCHS